MIASFLPSLWLLLCAIALLPYSRGELPALKDIFDVATARDQPGSCSRVQMNMLRGMFVQMQDVISRGSAFFEHLAEKWPEWPELDKVGEQAMMNLFDLGLAEQRANKGRIKEIPGLIRTLEVALEKDKGQLTDEDREEMRRKIRKYRKEKERLIETNDLLMKKLALVKDWTYTMERTLVTNRPRTRDEVTQLYCDSTFLKYLDTSQPIPASMEEAVHQMSVQLLLNSVEELLEKYWIFYKETGNQRLMVHLSKSEFPPKENGHPAPFVNGQPSLCAADVYTVNARPTDRVVGETEPPITILCPGFWERRGANNDPLPSRIDLTEKFPAETSIMELEPLWLMWYHEIFLLLLQSKARQQPVYYANIPAGLTLPQALQRDGKAEVLVNQGGMAWNFNQCMVLTFHDWGVLDEADLVSLTNIQNHVWFHLTIALFYASRQDWSTGEPKNMGHIPRGALAD